MILTTVALVLVSTVLMSSARGYSYNTADASSFTKRSYTNCEGHACHSLICINDACLFIWATQGMHVIV